MAARTPSPSRRVAVLRRRLHPLRRIPSLALAVGLVAAAWASTLPLEALMRAADAAPGGPLRAPAQQAQAPRPGSTSLPDLQLSQHTPPPTPPHAPRHLPPPTRPQGHAPAAHQGHPA